MSSYIDDVLNPGISAIAHDALNKILKEVKSNPEEFSPGRMLEILRKAAREGVKEGIRMHAWWKDGTQYVGIGTQTLQEELEEIDARAEG